MKRSNRGKGFFYALGQRAAYSPALEVDVRVKNRRDWWPMWAKRSYDDGYYSVARG
jgi:hypothetical protein